MLLIQNKLISLDLVEQKFVCNLAKCKGACCWEGDFGAPLEKEEIEVLEKINEDLKDYISIEGKQAIKEQGFCVRYFQNEEDSFLGTPLLDNGACAYINYDQNGVAQCGIENAYKDGKVDFQKPLSCHLYPVRIKKNETLSFEALNYDSWEICKPACEQGELLKIPIYQFVKSAIIRKYGPEFYDELDAAAQEISKESK
ncbi:MAG: DUF3109 family protein [Bacteroidota bacterium]